MVEETGIVLDHEEEKLTEVEVHPAVTPIPTKTGSYISLCRYDKNTQICVASSETMHFNLEEMNLRSLDSKKK